MVPNIITWVDFPSKKQNILSDVSHLTEVTWLPSTLQQTQKKTWIITQSIKNCQCLMPVTYFRQLNQHWQVPGGPSSFKYHTLCEKKTSRIWKHYCHWIAGWRVSGKTSMNNFLYVIFFFKFTDSLYDGCTVTLQQMSPRNTHPFWLWIYVQSYHNDLHEKWIKFIGIK